MNGASERRNSATPLMSMEGMVLKGLVKVKQRVAFLDPQAIGPLI